MRILELTEFVPRYFPRESITEAEGELLWRHYRDQVSVDFPSPKTGNRWGLTAKGWAGFIPLTQDLGISLLPKIPLSNLFGMLEWAYKLRSFKFLNGVFHARTIEEFYERLALVLAQRVIERNRKGLYQEYVSYSDDLPFLTGRIDWVRRMRQPLRPEFRCDYQEHTADNEDNQLIAWTLHSIARTGLCGKKGASLVRNAYRLMQGAVSLRPFRSQACTDRSYHRLNEDYRSLHSLCRLFLENSGPTHHVGDQSALPFLVNMARLYETFVGEWLNQHLPQGWLLRIQEQVICGRAGDLNFRIDLVLYETGSGRPHLVIDTKYKAPNKASREDVTQVLAYAAIKDCMRAVLVYPDALPCPLDEKIGNVRVKSLSFPLDRDLDEAGEAFVGELLALIPAAERESRC